jgi:hypothetical protein
MLRQSEAQVISAKDHIHWWRLESLLDDWTSMLVRHQHCYWWKLFDTGLGDFSSPRWWITRLLRRFFFFFF